MKTSVITAFSALLVGLVAAAPLEKREYLHVTTTEEVIEIKEVTTTITVDPTSSAQYQYSYSWAHTSATPTPEAKPEEYREEPKKQEEKKEEKVEEKKAEPAKQPEQNYVQPSQSVAEAAPASTTPSVTVAQQAPATTEEAKIETPTPSPAYVAPVTTSAAPVAPIQQENYVSPPSGGDSYKGEVTFYDAGLGACGWVNDGSTENVVALAHGYMGEQSNGNPFCGKMIEVTHNGKKVIAKVVDKCMGCSGMDIDLSRVAFGQIANFDEGRLTSGCSWKFV